MNQDSSLQFVSYRLIYMDFCRYIAKTNGCLSSNIEKNQIVVVWLRQFDFSQIRGEGPARSARRSRRSRAKSYEGQATLDLLVRSLARLYPAITFLSTGAAAKKLASALESLARAANKNIGASS